MRSLPVETPVTPPVCPQSTLPNFKQSEFSVVRQHEEFIWLHDSFVENEDYAGYIVSVAGWTRTSCEVFSEEFQNSIFPVGRFVCF